MQRVEGSYAGGQKMLAAEVVSSLLVVSASHPVSLAAVLLPVQNSLQLDDLQAMEMPESCDKSRMATCWVAVGPQRFESPAVDALEQHLDPYTISQST